MTHIQSRYSYQNEYLNLINVQTEKESLEKEIKYLKAKCSKLMRERNYYIHEGPVLELFKKYTGLYIVEEAALFLHHFVDNKSIFPYGDGCFEGEYSCVSVRGSWDNWENDYLLKKRCVRDSDGIYEGYVYYIIEENIVPGHEYEFKFKDADDEWIEPIYDGETEENSWSQVKLKQNNSGIWNAIITVRSNVEN